jgi:ATP-dependent DNA ligase
VSHETHRSLENDGHRMIIVRAVDTVTLYARSGRVLTPYWMDLALAGMELRPGTALDGEAVIWRHGQLDFGAARSRAASPVTRARALAARYPASYACWDLVQHPTRRSATPAPSRTRSGAPCSWNCSPMSARRSSPYRQPMTGT